MAACLLTGTAGGLAGQQGAPRLGLWFGGESIPQALDPACGSSRGTEGGWTVGGYVSVPLGRLLLEGRTSRHVGVDHLCVLGARDRPPGVHTIASPDLSVGDFTKTDARLRLDLGTWPVVGLGAGWVWSKEVPYVAGSLGARFGRSLRFGVDLEATTYRVPWRSRTAEFDECGEEARILSREAFNDWGGGVSLRFMLEVPLGGVH